jgi:hypothetical protein
MLVSFNNGAIRAPIHQLANFQGAKMRNPDAFRIDE